MSEQIPGWERNETTVEPVEVRFGDVVMPITNEETPDRKGVVIEANERFLQVAIVTKRAHGEEFLSPPGTWFMPIEVVDHWDIDTIVEMTVYPYQRDIGPVPDFEKSIRTRYQNLAEKSPVTYTAAKISEAEE